MLTRLENLTITEISAVGDEDGGPANGLPGYMVMKSANRPAGILGAIREAIAAGLEDLFDGVDEITIRKSIDIYGELLTVLIAGGVQVTPSAAQALQKARHAHRGDGGRFAAHETPWDRGGGWQNSGHVHPAVAGAASGGGHPVPGGSGKPAGSVMNKDGDDNKPGG